MGTTFDFLIKTVFPLRYGILKTPKFTFCKLVKVDTFSISCEADLGLAARSCRESVYAGPCEEVKPT